MEMRRGIFGIMVAVVMIAGCGGGKQTVMGPEETVEAFCRAVSVGKFDEAMSLCDTMTMKKYIDTYAQAWDVLEKKDSNTLAIAAASLAEAEFMIEDIIKEGDRRHVFFRLTFNGEEKQKLAITRKEEGAWKVETIIDRP